MQIDVWARRDLDTLSDTASGATLPRLDSFNGIMAFLAIFHGTPPITRSVEAFVCEYDAERIPLPLAETPVGDEAA